MGMAKGIHAHDTLKLGLKKPKNAPALKLGPLLTGAVPDHPVAADHFGKVQFGLYQNDKFGVCGPTSVANLVRLVTAALAGEEIDVTQDDVFDLYRRSGNPNFDPKTGDGDNGVDMQTMLEALLEGGIAGIKPVAFAKLDAKNADELDAAVSIFGGVLWGVELMVAQQAQSSEKPPVWDFSRSAIWGGHAVMNGKYVDAADATRRDVISWAEDVATTPAFDARQVQEAWVVVWQWNVDHPAFQAGVDLAALSAAYQDLTGRPLNAPGIPTPDPSPAPDDPDVALWASVGEWATVRRHYGLNRETAEALASWAKAKGYAAPGAA